MTARLGQMGASRDDVRRRADARSFAKNSRIWSMDRVATAAFGWLARADDFNRKI